MRMNRREFVAALSMLATNLAHAHRNRPANRNIKWALSEALWRYYPPAPFSDMLEVMQGTGFIGVRLASFPRILSDYQMTPAQMLREVSKFPLPHAEKVKVADPPMLRAIAVAKTQLIVDPARKDRGFHGDHPRGPVSSIVTSIPPRSSTSRSHG